VKHEDYDTVQDFLGQAEIENLKGYLKNDKDREVWERAWPYGH
jgi:hypothetical protein